MPRPSPVASGDPCVDSRPRTKRDDQVPEGLGILLAHVDVVLGLLRRRLAAILLEGLATSRR